MKTFFVLLIVCSLLCACSKKGSSPTPMPFPPANSIVGNWKWAGAYLISFEPTVPVFFDKGTISFNANHTFSRLKGNGTADSGTYTVFKSLIAGTDSLNFSRTTSPPAYPILDSTFDYYTVKGDTLRMGAVSPPGSSIWVYGTVDVYIRQ